MTYVQCSLPKESPKPLFEPAEMSIKKMNILIGVTGSVAAIKIVELVTALRTEEAKVNTATSGIDLKIILTKSAKYFTGNVLELRSKLGEEGIEVLEDEDEWNSESGLYKRGDAVTHIELRKWADLLLIAPLDANTLAKMSNGLCDNLLTCVLRCWDPKKPLFLAPAMNTMMWTHPITAAQIDTITGWGFTITLIDPVSKLLACGDLGIGGMESVDEIARLLFTEWRDKHGFLP